MRFGLRTALLAALTSGIAGADAQADTRCIAHRGNNIAELENSLSSLRSARALGAHGIEFDVRHTEDGQAVLAHDATLSRVARGDRCPRATPINALGFQEIRERCELNNGEPVPRLDEVLEEAKGWEQSLFVELKDQPSEQTVSLLDDYLGRMGDRLNVISFDLDALSHVSESGVRLFRLARTRLFPSAGEGPWTNHDLAWVSGRRVDRIRDAGGEVIVWTVNSASRMRYEARKGVSWITTDDPATCMAEMRRAHGR